MMVTRSGPRWLARWLGQGVVGVMLSNSKAPGRSADTLLVMPKILFGASVIVVCTAATVADTAATDFFARNLGVAPIPPLAAPSGWKTH